MDRKNFTKQEEGKNEYFFKTLSASFACAFLAMSCSEEKTSPEIPLDPLTGTVKYDLATAKKGIVINASVTSTQAGNGTNGYDFVWQIRDTPTGTFTEISPAATGVGYTPVDGDIGKHIRAVVTHSNFSESITGNAVLVEPAPTAKPSSYAIPELPGYTAKKDPYLSDDFETLDENRWHICDDADLNRNSYDDWSQLARFKYQNAYVKDGVLHLAAKKETYRNKSFTVGGIESCFYIPEGPFYVEVKMKFDRWTEWRNVGSLAWLCCYSPDRLYGDMANTNSDFNGFRLPNSGGVEIDIQENMFNPLGQAFALHKWGGKPTCTYCDDPAIKPHAEQKHNLVTQPNSYELFDWITYGALRYKDGENSVVKYYADGVHIGTITIKDHDIVDHPMAIFLNQETYWFNPNTTGISPYFTQYEYVHTYMYEKDGDSGLPVVTSITAKTLAMKSDGGGNIVAVLGNRLPSNTKLAAFDGETKIAEVAVSGSAFYQYGVLDFPENTSTEENKVYTIKVSFDGGTSWADRPIKDAKVKVLKK